MDKKQIKAEYRQKKAARRQKKKQGKAELRAQKKQFLTEIREEKCEDRRVYREALSALRPTETKEKKVPRRPVVQPPKRPVLEEIGNAITHGLGSLFAVWAFLSMLTHAEGALETVSACLYFAGMFIMFTMSCLYHSFRHGSTVKRLFQRFDHLSIYLLIGATFTPALLCYVGGLYGQLFFVVQWVIIATGVSLMGVFGPHRLKWLHFPMYIVLGWSALMLLPQMLAGDVGFALYILAGGIVYSLGIIPFLLRRGPAHFIWHFFVLAGAVVQWLGIRFYIYS